ncbi:gamma-glutamyl-gamma-aminobutyrate hydrolase PuuD/enamine deaminase RidA (YjgF/YER057c/UK114 family) [Mesorhizobium soli]|uniref:Atu1372/SO_1960 family protein n=1 Tax=Pseudaminobacter soli (ex Li et al. 2025) TaxID=1295366 RepID=UPI0024732361|nr:Atu1372/SO_1960 family protein [Mesorhizobium soli]MDH6233834.1 gamma-glutamyl-gamma-aminobutyrate hydrolase PuuD/enamine deaminase RidA (YjgF/YER057c/UK114 family) [Mesorhizobium soli]
MTTSTHDRRAACRQQGRRPVILMTPDFRRSADGWTEREYVVRANYAEAISEAGGTALILPYEKLEIATALELADGVMITGTTPGLEATPERREFELALVRQTLESGKPLLGICHGMQLIGEWLGGTFVTSLPKPVGEPVEHMPGAVPSRLAHTITVEASSGLARVLGGSEIEVNSLHRHALTGSGRFRVAARARDGVIEAFEGDTSCFCLGVQWHPEYRLTEFDKAILRDFVERCARTAREMTAPRGPCIVRERIAALGLALPEAAVPPGAFVGAIRSGDIVTVSGQVPIKNKAVLRTGHLGADVSLEAGRECARWALLNALAQLERIAGRLDQVQGFVRLAGYVAAIPGFTQHGSVVDGASELLREIFPETWSHARVAIGVASLPRGVPVEIELTAVLCGARD